MALILKRKDEQKILIGDNTYVTVYRCRVGQCKLKIDAPDDVRVVRAELLEEEESDDRADSAV